MSIVKKAKEKLKDLVSDFQYWMMTYIDIYYESPAKIFKECSSAASSFVKMKRVWKFYNLKKSCGECPDFMYPYRYAKILQVFASTEMWKDKYSTPRHEQCPSFFITLFNRYMFGYYLIHQPNTNEELIKEFCHYNQQLFDFYKKYADSLDDFWEQFLWMGCEYFSTNISKQKYPEKMPDLVKAYRSWPWSTCLEMNSDYKKKHYINTHFNPFYLTDNSLKFLMEFEENETLKTTK